MIKSKRSKKKSRALKKIHDDIHKTLIKMYDLHAELDGHDAKKLKFDFALHSMGMKLIKRAMDSLSGTGLGGGSEK